jgi:hypothetical protein
VVPCGGLGDEQKRDAVSVGRGAVRAGSRERIAVGVDLERIVIVAEQGRLHFGHEPFDMLGTSPCRASAGTYSGKTLMYGTTRVTRAALDHQTGRKLLRARLVDQEESRRMIAVVGQRRVRRAPNPAPGRRTAVRWSKIHMVNPCRARRARAGELPLIAPSHGAPTVNPAAASPRQRASVARIGGATPEVTMKGKSWLPWRR